MTAKPRSLLYRDALAAAEQQIVEALPAIVGALIERAQEGDLKAGAYLLDRIYGKAAGSAVPAADDRREPLTEEEYERDREAREEAKGIERDERKSGLAMRRLLAGMGASLGT